MVRKNALVTGYNGFVGRHIVPALRDAGYSVDRIDIHPAPGDVARDARDFFRLDNFHYDLVVHLAALVGGRQKIEGSPLDLAVDLSIDAEMYGWALRTRPRKVVYFSSSAAYPIAWQSREHKTIRLPEDGLNLNRPQMPDMIYGWVKLTGEMLASHARNKGLDVLVMRPFSGYGPDQDLDYPFPSFARRAALKQDPFEIWGDGSASRDWIHIEDICGATIAAVEQNIEGPINLGTGVATSFQRLADMMCIAADYRPQFHYDQDKPQGVFHRVCNPSKMLSFYTPQIGLEEGIREAIACVSLS